jgi:ribosomal protein S15P/S13E
MTDTPRATACPEDGCHALIPATAEDRANHMAGHVSDKKARRALTDELREMRELLAQIKEDNRNFRKEISNLEIPEPTDPLVIEEWPDDEIPEDDPESTYLEDITPSAVTIADTVAGEPAESPADDFTPDGISGIYTPRNLMS